MTARSAARWRDRHRRSRSSPAGAADRSACTRLAPRLPCRRACASPPEPFPHPEIDLGLRGGPVGGAVEPAPHHLGARPGIEDVLGLSREGPLDTHHAAELLAHRRTFRSSRYSPTKSKRRPQRSRWLSIQSEASASASGRNASRWVRPTITRLTTPASSSIRRCREMVGFETPEPRVTSPTVAGPPLRRSTISRRSGWARALNVSLAILLIIGAARRPRQEVAR